ncbi:MAG TPA: DNA-formamidopyrimidine glycosylase family protein [Nocardioidaceae bacterium]|nr:DNA-formamidopyrimidine glycosylase family protein [Nocardioidaceae bacterium]
MPELPEVAALVDDLTARLSGRAITRVDVVAISALKTFDPPPTALVGLLVDGVSRHGKFLDIDASGVHLVVHLARAGWLRWRDSLPDDPPKPGRGPLALRVGLDDQTGFDITEAGTRKRLAIYVVHNPSDVPGIVRLGPDPLAEDFTPESLQRILTAAGRAQLKGVLRDQSLIAGIGNAYSDELLHAAQLSPYKPAANLSGDEVQRLYAVTRGLLGEAIERARGLGASELKSEKKSGLRVHGRAGQPCPVCGDTIREVSFADSALQYCATCQTAGKPLADRRLSRLLK